MARLPLTWRSLSLAAAAVLMSAYTAFSAPLQGDYPGPFCRGCDRAAPPIDALAGGHIATFFHTQPVMGPFTLLLRAPVVAIARAAGGGQLSQYRLGDFACLLLVAALLSLPVSRMPQWRWRWPMQALVLGLVLVGPMTMRALWWGHPEEIVGGALCVAAVLLAWDARPLAAGIALGLAVATKQWGLLAIVPTLIACSRERKRLLGAAALVAVVLIAPMLAGDPSLFLWQALHAGVVSGSGSTAGVTPTNIWFAYGAQVGAVAGPGGGTTYGIPSSLAAVTHPVAIAVGVGIPLLLWSRLRGASAADLLMLFALVMLLRCLLDPLAASYHHVPFLVALAASEGLRGRGLPILSVLSAAALWILAHEIAPIGNAVLLNLTYLAWALPMAGFLLVRCYLVRAEPRSAHRLQVHAAR